MSDGDPRDGLRVSSGAGGTAAVLEDMDSAAAQLIRAGTELGDLAMAAFRLAIDPYVLGSVVVCPRTGVAAESALASLVGGGRGFGAEAARTVALGVALRSTTELYRDADALAAHALGVVMIGVVGAGFPVIVVLGASAVVTGNGKVLLGLLGSTYSAGDLLVGAVPGAIAAALPTKLGKLVPRSPQDLAGLASRSGELTGVLHETGRVSTQVSGTATGRAPSGLSETVTRLRTTADTREGTIQVEQITGPDGARAWIVEIPGTQDWSGTGSNPLDVTSAVATEAGAVSAASMLVSQALAERGVRPDEPVMLVGHSLGGMAAAQVASSSVLRGRANITHVVTMGSPIGKVSVPAAVKVLSLANDDDPVPWLDGARNPDRPNRVEVHADNNQQPKQTNRTPDDGNQAQPSGHSAREYARAAARVDASNDPSIAKWREGTEVFFDRPGATSSTWQVTGQRVAAAP